MKEPTKFDDLRKTRGAYLSNNELKRLKRATRQINFSKAVLRAIEILEKEEVQSIAFPVYIQDENGESTTLL